MGEKNVNKEDQGFKKIEKNIAHYSRQLDRYIETFGFFYVTQ